MCVFVLNVCLLNVCLLNVCVFGIFVYSPLTQISTHAPTHTRKGHPLPPCIRACVLVVLLVVDLVFFLFPISSPLSSLLSLVFSLLFSSLLSFPVHLIYCSKNCRTYSYMYVCVTVRVCFKCMSFKCMCFWYARKLSKRMSNIRRTHNWRSNTKLKTRSRLECDRPKGAFRLGQMERGRQLVEGWDRLVMDGIPWENIFSTDGEVVMLGRKNLAVYCLAQSLSMGFELTTAAALASRQYLVSEQVVIAIWYKWNKSEEAFVMSMRGKAS